MILSIPCWCKNEFLLLLLLLTGCLVFVTASIFAVSTKNVPSVKWKLGKNGHSSERIIRQVAVRTMKENITRAVQVFFFFRVRIEDNFWRKLCCCVAFKREKKKNRVERVLTASSYFDTGMSWESLNRARRFTGEQNLIVERIFFLYKLDGNNTKIGC